MNNITEYPLVSDPNYMKIYNFEKFDILFWRYWLKQNWTLSLVFTAIYVAFIFTGRKWMKNRERMELRKSLIAWNVGLAVFSIFAFSRSFPELWNTLIEPNGLHKSICLREGLTYSYAFWALLGAFSKVAELGDTFFIVFRKQNLIFLHPYHHITVMIYTWFTYDAQDPSHRWFMTVNYFVHSLMYTYYGLRAAGIKLPRKLAMCITVLQICQMIMGTFVNLYSLRAIYSTQQGCDRYEKNIFLALTMYATYFYLFVDFFKKAYFKKTKLH